MTQRDERNQEYWTARVQRWSGVLLAVFLPVHLYVLSLALGDGKDLDSFLTWTDSPLVKFAEGGLVLLLSLHMLSGIRILLIEFHGWRAWQKSLISVSAAGALFFALMFWLRAL